MAPRELAIRCTSKRPSGVIISDDIERNAAFQELAECSDVAFHAAIRELQKDSLLGVLAKTT